MRHVRRYRTIVRLSARTSSCVRVLTKVLSAHCLKLTADNQAINMSVLVYSPDKVYLPDVQDHSCSLGHGGCFTKVER